MYMHPTFGGLAAIAQGDFRIVSYDSNTDEVVRTYGLAVGLETNLFKIYDLNISSFL